MALKRPCRLRLSLAVLPLFAWLVVAATPARAAAPKGGESAALWSQVTIEKKLLGRDLDDLTRIANQVSRNSERVLRLAGDQRDLLKDDSRDPFTLDERESSLREAEAILRAWQDQFREIRIRIVNRRQQISLLQDEIQKRRDEAQKSGDIVTGSWDLVSYPGPVKGTFELSLEGTLISGEYNFDGNWRGSLRGNLAGDRVRLERWDAELGFSAIYYGRLFVAEKTIKGTWEATDLSGGKPTSGTWVARRKEEQP